MVSGSRCRNLLKKYNTGRGGWLPSARRHGGEHAQRHHLSRTINFSTAAPRSQRARNWHPKHVALTDAPGAHETHTRKRHMHRTRRRAASQGAWCRALNVRARRPPGVHAGNRGQKASPAQRSCAGPLSLGVLRGLVASAAGVAMRFRQPDGTAGQQGERSRVRSRRLRLRSGWLEPTGRGPHQR